MKVSLLGILILLTAITGTVSAASVGARQHSCVSQLSESHAMAVAGKAMNTTDGKCPEAERCHGSCAGAGCVGCQHVAILSGISQPPAKSIVTPPLSDTMHYLSIHPAPESPPPRPFSS